MKNCILFILCLSLAEHCFAQSLSLEVVSTSGDVFSAVSGSLEWTLGEIMTETFEKNNSVLTQGFHQPEKTNSQPEIGYQAYPNPVPDYLNVKIIKKGTYLVEVFNLWGQKLIAQNVTLAFDDGIFQIEMKGLDSALYVLRLLNISTNESISLKIVKI